jgi:hypothetical protein
MYRKKGVVWLVQISGKSAKNEGQSYFNNSLGDLQLNISHRSHLEAVSHWHWVQEELKMLKAFGQDIPITDQYMMQTSARKAHLPQLWQK